MKTKEGPSDKGRSQSADVMNSPLEVIKRHKSQLVFLLVTLGLMCPAVYFLSLEITELRQWMF